MPGCVNLISAQQLANKSRLMFKEWQLVDHIERSSLGKIKATQPFLSRGSIKRILSTRNGVTASEGREDFARVVYGLAEGKGTTSGQAMQILDAQTILQTAVPGIRSVFAVADVCEVAIHPLSRLARSSRSRARRYSRRDEGGKVVGQ